MRLLVTGAAGFIGSNFVRSWLERQPDDHVVAFDLLTYAGNRSSLEDVEDRIVFVQGDIADGDLAERVVRDERIDTIVNFAAESHNSLAVVDPARFFRTNVARDAGAARCRAGGRAGALPPRLHLRGVRRSRARLGRRVHRGPPVPPSHAVQRVEGRRPTTPCARTTRPTGSRSRSRNCSNNYGPYQFPEKVIPLFSTNALDDKPLPLYEATPEQARMAARRRPLPRDRARAARGRGSARPTTSARGSRRRSRRSPTRSSTWPASRAT